MISSSGNSLTVDTVYRLSNSLAFSKAFLTEALTTVDEALFFGKVYELDAQELSTLLLFLFPDKDVVQELTNGVHATELQSYIEQIDIVPMHTVVQYSSGPDAQLNSEVLAQLWEAAEIMIASSVSDVAMGLYKVMDRLPKHEASMAFRHLNKLNIRRNSIGDFRAVIHRDEKDRKRKVLVVLDDSGSMTSGTIQAIAEDVVALSYKANASLVQVSNSARFHRAGTFSVKDVLDVAEYGGTEYSKLKPIFDEDWDEVITIADYDSHLSAMRTLATCTGRIGMVTDVSLVNRTTYLSECLSQLADDSRQVMLAPTQVR